MPPVKLPVFFHEDQLHHKPVFEWAFGEKIPHPETTCRVESILAELEAHSPRFELRSPEQFPLALIKETHNKKMVEAIQSAASLPLGKTFYPSVFPYHRDKSNLDSSNIHHAGAFCFDSGTPLNATTFAAAAWSAACAFDAAKLVASGTQKYAYALSRPPGHHASTDLFGGYCYFNNAAIAAKVLRQTHSRVALVDIDFHHGNGTQVIFDRDPSVLVISLHGDPNEHYPHFTGYANETGSGKGKGFNINIPLPGGTDGQEYLHRLSAEVIPALQRFEAQALVLSAGFDTYVADPIGAFCLETPDFLSVGEQFAALKLPTVIVQEGGYESTSLGRNVVSLLEAFF